MASYFYAIYTSLYKTWFSPFDVHFAMIGLEGAGKTTILYKLRMGKIYMSIATVGFQVETLEYKGIFFHTFDVGGTDPPRQRYKDQLKENEVEGIIFVVDSANRAVIDEAREELWKILDDEEFKEKEMALLVIGNKSDLPNIMGEAEIAERLGLDPTFERKWRVQAASGKTGEGIYEGLKWLQDSRPGPRAKQGK